MLSMQLLRLIVEDRERDIQHELRVRRLLSDKAEPDAASATDGSGPRYRESWRARTPRASATTR